MNDVAEAVTGTGEEGALPVSDSEAARALAESAYEAAQRSPIADSHPPRSDDAASPELTAGLDAQSPTESSTGSAAVPLATAPATEAAESLSPVEATPAVHGVDSKSEAPESAHASGDSAPADVEAAPASAAMPDGAKRPGESWSVIAVSSVDDTSSDASPPSLTAKPTYRDLPSEIEVTQPFGLRLESTDLEDPDAPAEALDDTPAPADVPAASLKPRGFVVAEHGALLTTPVAPVIEHDLQSGVGASLKGEVPSTPRAPIELDDLSGTSDEPMQLASTWEFVGWQGGDTSGPIGHTPESTWADRVVDLEGPAVAPAASEVPLASAWDFIQQPWQPQTQAPAEVITTLLAAAASASTEVAPDGPAVTAEQVLVALDAVSTQGTLGKVVLAYCAGRFQRAFLLGESLGLARVGHAWGPGSDTEAVASLKVDLEAPSLLLSAMASASPTVFSAPECAQDEALFAALGGTGASHLAVIAIRNQGHAVAFIVADHGAEPVPTPALEELTRIAEKASDAFARLPSTRRG
ncbi:hypothetical protein [Comamonas sp. JC664]|uniref:hypothetical protein n=1 Tax=Comamonas sp. JC664 TaxID=2801917 RepID=UPI001E4BD664|nr:hypothetical protein [Comamonas sp. JC664]